LGIQPEELQDSAQRMVDDVAKYLRQKTAKSAPLPKLDSHTIWEHLEVQPQGATATLPIAWPEQSVEVAFVERVRLNKPSEQTSSFSFVEEASQELRLLRSTGFESALRGSSDEILLPTWLSTESFAMDEETGRFVLSGTIAHEFFGMSPAFDYGAISGANMFGFPEEGHSGGQFNPAEWIWVGSTKSGAIAPLDATVNTCSVDIDPNSGQIAALIFVGNGNEGAVVVYDTLGIRRVLTVLIGVAGNESIEFSSDGKWLLVGSTSIGHGCRLIEVETGRWVDVGYNNATWWPLDASTLLVLENEEGKNTPRLFSLLENEFVSSFPEITLDLPHNPDYPYIWDPVVDPGGIELLGQTPAGVTQEHQQEHGCGNRSTCIRLETGEGHVVQSVFIEGNPAYEREVRKSYWLSRNRKLSPVRLHPDISTIMNQPVTEHENLVASWGSNTAEVIVINALNRFVQQFQISDTSYLVPPVLAALIPLSDDNAMWERQCDWLVGLANGSLAAINNGEITGRSADAWKHFPSAISAILQGRSDLIDPMSATWV